MKDRLKALLEQSLRSLEETGSLEDAEALRIKILGKKGELTEMLKSMKDLLPEERKEFGQAANEAKARIEQGVAQAKARLADAQKRARFLAETIDVTEPGKERLPGFKHLVTATIDETVEFFSSMGYTIAEGPEIDTVHNNSPIYQLSKDERGLIARYRALDRDEKKLAMELMGNLSKKDD